MENPNDESVIGISVEKPHHRSVRASTHEIDLIRKALLGELSEQEMVWANHLARELTERTWPEMQLAVVEWPDQRLRLRLVLTHVPEGAW